MNRGVRQLIRGMVFCLLIFIFAGTVYAEPNGPESLNMLYSQRGAVENLAALSVDAQAGNISEIKITATTITKNWQGYFGNITGRITLDDASNWTLYDWLNANPKGRVYASRVNTVTWSTIDCMRFNANGSLYPNLTTEENDYLGASSTDPDGVDETFSIADHPTLLIGSSSIPANRCNSTFMYVNDTNQSTSFRELLLTDNSSNSSVIYTAIIEQNLYGFNNKTMDFEMLVAENGHGNSISTPYYFWVELE